MPRRKISARRQEYEAAFPTVTGRIPAAVKEKLAEILRAEDLNFSEWVQARVAGSGAQTSAAYSRGERAGREQGEVQGYQRGRTEGAQAAGAAGFRAGLLASIFAAEHRRRYDPATIARRLLERPDQRAIAERLVPATYQRDWARLMQAAEQGRAPAGTA